MYNRRWGVDDVISCFFFQAEDGIRDLVRSRGLGDVYKRQAMYRNFGLGSSIASDPMMSQGAGYLNALIGISMYVIPLGWLAMLTQSIWAHPPAQGTPDALITAIRTRGKQ